MPRVLNTATSFQDPPSNHYELFKECGWDVVYIRGTLCENAIYNLVGEYDEIICGDNVYSCKILEKAKPKLGFLSKYGIGLDKTDIPVLFTPLGSGTAVAEHAFMLLLMLVKKAILYANKVHDVAGSFTTDYELVLDGGSSGMAT